MTQAEESSQSGVSVRMPRVDDAAAIGPMHLQACLETYPNSVLGIDEASIRQRWDNSPPKRAPITVSVSLATHKQSQICYTGWLRPTNISLASFMRPGDNAKTSSRAFTPWLPTTARV